MGGEVGYIVQTFSSTLLIFSRNFQDALDATLLDLSRKFAHDLDATLLDVSNI